ncbi:hypothetical protein JRO89_XS02G0275300 [Xanthoceras sorbifolium]|uniref:Retrovirus-related Pol polyprotein from transposon TNT 1-94-like beta-barrel domain-containing protein n=1 Tax=Xanthoceras sorbifolium TaxID=99658 RepID=A0ABQ8IHW8_9ROSI|nr:hypothetical protein JRO89_XS02G0275300 [Xanthoceras sorbifolium]
MASDRTENFVQLAVPRFDGHYDHWSMLMENFLRSKEYWQVVDSGVAEPTKGIVLTDAQKTELEGQRLKDLKAKNYLFQAIDRSILETILSKETSKQIWDSMKKKYQGSSRVKRVLLQALRKDFETLQLKDALKASTFAESTNFRGRGRGRGMGARGHRDGSRQYQSFKSDDDQSNFSGKGRGRDQQFDKSKVECYRCHKLSHYRSDCYVRIPKDKESFGDCSTVSVMGKGDIQIKTRNGYIETISNVFYVPDLKSNLLSAGQLQQDIPVSFDEVEDLFVPQIQSSDADHSID